MTLLIVAAVLGFFFAGLVGFFYILLSVMRKTVRRDTDEAIAPLRDKVLKLFERAEALKARHQRLLGTGQKDVPPPAGDTAAAYERAGAKIREFWDLWTELQQRLDRVRVLVESESKWGRTKLDEARELAQQKENLSARADAAATEAEKLLDELEGAPERAVAAADRARAAMKTARAKLEEIERSGLSAAPYRAKIDAFEARVTEVEARLRSDPLGTAGAAEAAAKEVDGFASSPFRALDLRTEIARAAAEVDLVAQEVAAARKEGLFPPDDHVDPDDPERAIEAAREAAAKARAALEAARLDEASRASDDAARLTKDAATRLATARTARTEMPAELARRRKGLERLAALVGEAEAAEATLRATHAPGTYADALAGTGRAREALRALPEAIAAAEKLAQGPRPRWLAAARALDAAAKREAEAVAAAEAPPKRLRELEAIAARAREVLDHAGRQVAAAETGLAAKDDVVLRRAREATEAARKAVAAAAPRGPGPQDWPSLLAQAERGAALGAQAAIAVAGDIAAAGQLEAQREAARQAVADARRFIDEHEEDRPAANEKIARAERELEAAEAAGKRRDLDWSSVASLYAESAGLAEKARALAESDVRLARQAEGAVEDAERAIRGADRYFDHGISADMTRARTHLSSAAAALGRRAYEDAIREADAAEAAARESARGAETRSQTAAADLDRRRWAEEERRRSQSRVQDF